MKQIAQLLIGLSLLGVTGCTYYPATPDWTDGELVMRARFPDRAIQAIPDTTDRIEVRVSGEGIPKGSVLSATLTPEQTLAHFTGVPAGDKTVVVKAYSAEGEVVAAGSSPVTIVAGATVAARIRLALTTDEGQFQLILE